MIFRVSCIPYFVAARTKYTEYVLGTEYLVVFGLSAKYS